MKEIRILVPDNIYKRIRRICEDIGITPQDLLTRALVKVLEEFEKVKG